MASRPYAPVPSRQPRHQRNPQWRPERRPRSPVTSLAAALAVISILPRELLEQLTESLIDRLDVLDGDTDIEPNGDERDCCGDEADTSYPEWHTRGRKLGSKGEERIKLHAGLIGLNYGSVAHEDDEDSDPGGGNAEDEGENVPGASAMPRCRYGVDQRQVRGAHGVSFVIDRDDH